MRLRCSQHIRDLAQIRPAITPKGNWTGSGSETSPEVSDHNKRGSRPYVAGWGVTYSILLLHCIYSVLLLNSGGPSGLVLTSVQLPLQ